MIKISEDDKWKAVVECDRDYDGLFYYGVKTTKIFCKPSCRSKLPLRKNVVFFEEHETPLKKGFRPCKRCRPDLLTYDPTGELIIRIKDFIEKNYSRPLDIGTLTKDLGVSRSHLSRIFKESEKMSLVDYLTKTRIDKSKELLKNQDLKIIDIAYTVGFQSLSNYYRCFKKQLNLTPKEFRILSS